MKSTQPVIGMQLTFFRDREEKLKITSKHICASKMV